MRDLIESDLGDAQNRRARAVRAFLTQQYDDDKKIRFKQVDLQNDLLGLFIDVPVSVQVTGSTARERSADAAAWADLHASIVKNADESSGSFMGGVVDPGILSVAPRRRVFPTAGLLLDGRFQQRTPRVVIEGAPGQGKSTLTQYVCQVHRMRLLGKGLGQVPREHSTAPLRLPFRLDLRDVAEWMGGGNPFSSGDAPPFQWPRTLEGFLSASVYYLSGGVAFDVADLLAVIERSATVVVCDGLDEVADIGARRTTVEELTAAAGRLAANAASLQMIITSRPADFAKSAGFDSAEFRYMSLEALPPRAAHEYSEKWAKAKNLDAGDAVAVRAVLADKLNLPHMRELARNAMQLTILLSLIYARGSSLPDKRTALYDAYIDTFLDRESEKSAVVREHRDLLLALHGYLAWTLHHETEGGRSQGRISSQRLSDEISRYLGARGHTPGILGDLFDGVVERVFVLVSRVEGTYEFEVQPLREYFAARHLYNTAPHVPAGTNVKGTISERFDALARNPYWLNVARFYAGCFSEGEIGALVYGLRDLVEEEDFRVLAHPRVLAGMLLADWVFSQVPRSVPAAVEIMGDPLGVQLAGGAPWRRAVPVFGPLPEPGGQSQFAEIVVDQLDKNPKSEYANSLAQVLHEQAPGADLRGMWLERSAGKSGKARARWLQYGIKLGVVHGMECEQLDALLAPSASREELVMLMRAGRGDYCEQGPAAQVVVDASLDGEIVAGQRADDTPVTMLEEFGRAHLVDLYDSSVHNRHGSTPTRADTGIPGADPAVSESCRRVVDAARAVMARPLGLWVSSLEPWDQLVEVSRGEFGERWAHRFLALQAAGIRSSSETCPEASELFHGETPLTRRVRYARLRAGNPKWWGRQLDEASTSDERLFVAAILVAWASGRTLLAQIERLDQLLKVAKAREWERALEAVQRVDQTWQLLRRGTPRRLEVKALPGVLSERTVVMLAARHGVETQRELYGEYLRDYAGRHPAVLDLCVAAEMAVRRPDARAWRRVLTFLARHPGRPRVAFTPYALHYGASPPSIPLSIAQEICEDAERYPQGLVARAEDRCRSAVDFVAVGSVAQRRGWFSS